MGNVDPPVPASRDATAPLSGVIAARLEVEAMTFTQTEYPAGMRLGWHEHDLASFSYVVRGEYEESLPQRSRSCWPGMVIFHPGGERHADRHGPERVRLLTVQMSQNPRWGLTQGLFGVASEAGGVDIRRIGNRLAREIHSRDAATPIALEGLVHEMLAAHMRSSHRNDGRRPGWLSLVIARLRDDPVAPRSLSDLSALAGVHPAHLGRVFRRYERCTVGEYVRRLSVDRACRMLETGELTISEIALELGFADQSHLGRVFKAETGVTPMIYRRPRLMSRTFQTLRSSKTALGANRILGECPAYP